MNEQNKRILELLAEGRVAKEIAADVDLTVGATEKRIKRMKYLHNCNSTIELVLRFVKGECVYMVVRNQTAV